MSSLDVHLLFDPSTLSPSPQRPPAQLVFIMPSAISTLLPTRLTRPSHPRSALTSTAFLNKAIIKPMSSQRLPPLSRSFADRFPFILCTNGGGIPESERSQKLSKELGVCITPKRLVQSHTIFTQFLSSYQTKPILVVGGRGERCRLVAERYGFEQVYIPLDILRWNQSIWPFHKISDRDHQITKTADFSRISFSAIFVMHDSFDWGLDIQIAVDLLTSKDGIITNPMKSLTLDSPRIPVYFSNPDFLWGNEFSRPRFGQGAFQAALRANYESLTGRSLDAWTGGKPTQVTYDFANELLINIVQDEFHGHHLGRVYMIGDNPASDIHGANNYGWASVLVKTGVFKGAKPEDAQHVPTAVKDDVLEAVKWALVQEGQGNII